MLELTPKEIETAGYNRYMKEKRRLVWTVVVLAVGLALGLLLVSVLPKTMNRYAKGIIEILPMLAGFGYYYKVVFMDATKAGKKFQEEWEKERMIEGYKELNKESKNGEA